MYKFVYLEDGLDCANYVGRNVNIILIYILCYIAYWLTGSMEQSPSWETSQEIPPKFHCSIHKCLPPVPIMSPYQWINPGWRHHFIFCNLIRYYGEELFAPHPTLKLEYYPLSAVFDCYSIYSQPPTLLEAVPPSATEDVPCCGDRDPLILAILHAMMDL